jgi:hypothetical protein
VQVLRDEMDANVSKMRIELTQPVNTTIERVQVEAERRADAMLQKLTQMLQIAPKNHIDKAAPVVDTGVASGPPTRTPGSQRTNQPMRAAQPSWAAITGTGAQKLTGWTTVANSKKKTKKHPLTRGVFYSSETSSPMIVTPETSCLKSTKLLRTRELT